MLFYYDILCGRQNFTWSFQVPPITCCKVLLNAMSPCVLGILKMRVVIYQTHLLILEELPLLRIDLVLLNPGPYYTAKLDWLHDVMPFTSLAQFVKLKHGIFNQILHLLILI